MQLTIVPTQVHCLEAIRSSVMCRPDLTPLQFYWSNSEYHDLSVKPNASRTCMVWESFEAVRRSRTYVDKELKSYHKQGFDGRD